MLRQVEFALWFGLLTAMPGVVCAQNAAEGHSTPPNNVVYTVAFVLVAIIALATTLIVYVWSLRNRTADMVAADVSTADSVGSRVVAFNQLPMGVPRGTVRAVLALIVTFGSILFLAVSLIDSNTYKFPETLSGILGAILGFYFGKSTSGDDGAAVSAVSAANADTRQALSKAADAADTARTAQQQLSDTQDQLSDVKASHNALAGGDLDAISNDLQKAADLGQTLASVLPGDIGKDIGLGASALKTTQSAISALRSGDLLGAVDKAGQLVADAAPNLPAVQVLNRAVQLIGPVLGTVFPPALLLTTIIGVGTKLSAAAYTRWIARVMDEPYTPEKFSATVFDSNAAIGLLQELPAMKQALATRLSAGDRAAALDVVQLALGDDAGTALFQKYAAEFANLDQTARDAALHDLQTKALDYVLLRELPADAGAAVGGPQAMLDAIDKIRANRDASAGLDMVMQTASELKRAQLNPAVAFEDAAKHLQAGSAGK